MIGKLSDRVVGGKRESNGCRWVARALVWGVVLGVMGLGLDSSLGQDPLVSLFKSVQTRVVKIYGAGKIGGLENYQSGFLITEQGHIATAWSTVLDAEVITILTDDGKRWEAALVGLDPQTEMAMLKIEGDGFPHFDMRRGGDVEEGDRVFGVTNLFNIATGRESPSVQRGVVMAKSQLMAHRGRMQTPYTGSILVIDVLTNNPGAMGGALVNLEGALVGMVGKELRDDATGNWLNFAMPTEVVAASMQRIQKGETVLLADGGKALKPVDNPHRALELGFALVPNVLSRTPAYVNQVRVDSMAAKCGLKANDLILTINGKRVESRRHVDELLASINRADAVRMMVKRGSQLVSIDMIP